MPHAIHTPPQALALYSAAQSRAIEAAAQATLPPHTLMERAGLALARLILALPRPVQGPVLFACGPGNNGGDGLVAARLLQQQGLAVQVHLIEPEVEADTASARPSDAQAALLAAQAAGVRIQAGWPTAAQPSLAVDALLGLGLSRAPAGALKHAIERLNALTHCERLAVDLPSGMLADTGMPAPITRDLGSAPLATSHGCAVQAQHCLSLLTLKPGLFTGQGRALCGRIRFDALGVQPESEATAELLGLTALGPWRNGNQGTRHQQHKGSQGDVLVIGGAPGMRGAARLAARAALAAGAGRVHVWLLDGAPAAAELDPERPELMHWPWQQPDALTGPEPWRGRTVVCGCGGSKAVAAILAPVLQQAARLVLDADGLNAIAAEPRLRQLLRQRTAKGQPSLLTPHPLEAARLLGCDVTEVQAERLQAAQALADQLACTVLLKGSGSVIASPQASSGLRPRTAINSSGHAALATAGSGDVLAGWMGGLWTQESTASAQTVASAACLWHGLAGETQAAGPLRAADLVERMHALHPR